MTMRRAAYHCSTLLAFTIVLVAVPSGAAAVTVRGVDATAYPTLGVTVVTEHAVARSPRIFEGRVPVAGVRAQNLGAAKSVVLAVDRSRSMQGRPLADAVSAARLFLAAKSPVDRASIVSFGADALELTRFASDTGEAGRGARSARGRPPRGHGSVRRRRARRSGAGLGNSGRP